MHEVLGDQITVSAVIVFLLQWLKNASWFPWLHDQSARVNRVVAVILSAAAAIGIHAQFDATAGVLTITGLTLATIAHGAWEWIRSFAVQQMIFKVTASKNGILVAPKP